MEKTKKVTLMDLFADMLGQRAERHRIRQASWRPVRASRVVKRAHKQSGSKLSLKAFVASQHWGTLVADYGRSWRYNKRTA